MDSRLSAMCMKLENSVSKQIMYEVYFREDGVVKSIKDDFLRYIFRLPEVEHVILRHEDRIAASGSWLYIGRVGKRSLLSEKQIDEETLRTNATMSDNDVFMAMQDTQSLPVVSAGTSKYRRFKSMCALSGKLKDMKHVAEIKLIFKYSGNNTDFFTDVYDSSSVVLGAVLLDIAAKRPNVSAVIVQVVSLRMIRLMHAFGFKRVNSTSSDGMWYAIVGDWLAQIKKIMKRWPTLVDKKTYMGVKPQAHHP